MQNLYIVLFMYLLFIQYSSNNEIKLKQCHMHKLNDCPEYSECTEINISIGECKCIENYLSNKNYNDDKIYCVYNPNAKPAIITTEINNASNIPKSSKTAAVINSSENETTEKNHHIVGGILIPIFIILFIILTAYGIKRLEIIRRFRDYQLRRRRQRPFYEDVMMSQDTNDDPPLI